MLELLMSEGVLKILLPVLGVLTAVLGIYLKGRSDGSTAVEKELDEATDKVRSDVRKAEKKAREVEKKRRDNSDEIRDAGRTGLGALIDLWNKKRGGKK